MKAQTSKRADRANISTRDLEIAIERGEAKELIRAQQQGLGRSIISGKVGEHQIVAVGSTLHSSKHWRFFPDFLADYIKITLGSDWGNAEIRRPLEDRHPIMQWHHAYCQFQRSESQVEEPDGSFHAEATGVVYCYMGLAYNLYLIKHNVELQARLVARLKDPKQFQGAYHELIVANCLIRAGFELALEDETDDSSKHCEFSATSGRTGAKYWVEAKMRAVSGLLGKTDLDGSKDTSKPTSQLSRHVGDALAKPAEDERMIFVDVNADWRDLASSESGRPKWAEPAGKILDAREKVLREGEAAYVFVTNIPFHRQLEEPAQYNSVLAHGLGIPDFAKIGHYRLSELWRQKQKHIDAHEVLKALRSYPSIPNTFDGSLPLTDREAADRIEIGKAYFFNEIGEEGLVAEVTSAIISEEEKKMYIGTSKGQIITREVSESELAAYRAHKDAFFGVIHPAQRTSKDPQELHEWLVKIHRGRPKEKLLEICKDHPDIENLAKLGHLDLVLEVCERMCWSLWRRGSTEDSAAASPSE